MSHFYPTCKIPAVGRAVVGLYFLAGLAGSQAAPVALTVPDTVSVDRRTSLEAVAGGAHWSVDDPIHPVDCRDSHFFPGATGARNMRTELKSESHLGRQPGGFNSSLPQQVQSPRRCGRLVVRCSGEWDASATRRGELRQRVTNHRWCAAAFDTVGNSKKNQNHHDFEPLPGEMIPYAKLSADASCFAREILTVSSASPSERLAESIWSPPISRTTHAQLIYAVDDAPELTELYTILLEGAGYVVRTFNDRTKALVALKAERTKPDLLITDCAGPSMSVERFVACCLGIHPTLRVLMASGYSQTDLKFLPAKPERFIQKPFTAEEFLRRVRATIITQ